MELEESLKNLSERTTSLRDTVNTEEATKHSFVMPFLSALGYDIFNPTVVVPEFTADISRKKNEKVDYAILHDGKPLILIEVKTHTENLDNHATQLERYFSVTDTRFAILTNGIEYRIFTDLEKTNKMDDIPFFKFNLLDLKKRDIKELEKFKSENFDIENIVESAEKKKYISGIKSIFKEESLNPSEDFIRLFASRLTDRVLRQNVLEEFKPFIKIAFSEMITDLAQERINSLKNNLNVQMASDENEEENEIIEKDGINTTEEELEGFFIVKSILAEEVELKRIFARDTKSYFGVLLDDNNRKWICRLHFNTRQKYLGLHIEDRKEKKIPLENLEDIYNHKQTIIDIFNRIK